MVHNSIFTAFGLPNVYTYLDWVRSQADWLQWVIYGVAALLVLVGFFTIIKKFIKVFFVIAILGGGVFYLWTQTSVLDSVKEFISGFGLYITNLF